MPPHGQSLLPHALLVPITGPKAHALLRLVEAGGYKRIELPQVTLFLNGKNGPVVFAVIGDPAGNGRCAQKDPIRSIRFFPVEPPFRVAINGREGFLNALPFAVLSIVLGGFRTIKRHQWPKGCDLAERCAALRERIDRRFKPIRIGTRGDQIWAGWLNLTRKELRVQFPEISEYDLLPDGKTSRGCGVYPKLSADCVIRGVDLTFCQPSTAKTRSSIRQATPSGPLIG